MEPSVLGDLVARERRSDALALDAPALGRDYDYRRFCTTAWKVGNFLHHIGVRSGVAVGVAADPVPEPVLTLFGAALLGAPVRFLDGDPDGDTRAVVVPTGSEEVELPPGGQRVVYGDPPEDPSTSYFERDVWSQNPTEPPDPVAPDDVALRADGEHSHRDLLEAAEGVVGEWGLEPGESVAVRAPLTHPGTVAAGVVAPLLAGGTVLLPAEGSEGDYAVGAGPEPGVDPDDVLGV
jgi:hypothetical protein